MDHNYASNNDRLNLHIESTSKSNNSIMHSMFHAAIVKQSYSLHCLSDFLRKYLLRDVLIKYNHSPTKMDNIRSFFLVKLDHSARHVPSAERGSCR